MPRLGTSPQTPSSLRGGLKPQRKESPPQLSRSDSVVKGQGNSVPLRGSGQRPDVTPDVPPVTPSLLPEEVEHRVVLELELVADAAVAVFENHRFDLPGVFLFRFRRVEVRVACAAQL